MDRISEEIKVWGILRNSIFYPSCCSNHKVSIKKFRQIDTSKWIFPELGKKGKISPHVKFSQLRVERDLEVYKKLEELKEEICRERRVVKSQEQLLLAPEYTESEIFEKEEDEVSEESEDHETSEGSEHIEEDFEKDPKEEDVDVEDMTDKQKALCEATVDRFKFVRKVQPTGFDAGGDDMDELQRQNYEKWLKVTKEGAAKRATQLLEDLLKIPIVNRSTSLDEIFLRRWQSIHKEIEHTLEVLYLNWTSSMDPEYMREYVRYREEHGRNPLKYMDSKHSGISGLEIKSSRRWGQISKKMVDLKDEFHKRYLPTDVKVPSDEATKVPSYDVTKVPPDDVTDLTSTLELEFRNRQQDTMTKFLEASSEIRGNIEESSKRTKKKYLHSGDAILNDDKMEKASHLTEDEIAKVDAVVERVFRDIDIALKKTDLCPPIPLAARNYVVPVKTDVVKERFRNKFVSELTGFFLRKFQGNCKVTKSLIRKPSYYLPKSMWFEKRTKIEMTPEDLRPDIKLLIKYFENPDQDMPEAMSLATFPIKDFIIFTTEIETDTPEEKRRIALHAIKIYFKFFQILYKRLFEKFSHQESVHGYLWDMKEHHRLFEIKRLETELQLMNLVFQFHKR